MSVAPQPWLEQIEQMRSEGLINADDEAALIRQLNDCQAAIEEALARIAPEYQRRVGEDGKESADAWLAATAREIGEREGAGMRRIFEQFTSPGLTAESA
ncbi:hypothetical protein QFW77_03295 [Luteimonas sp. RD2P54]|uniref:DUF4404 family protein n=1 Tax=Luteimonas endophytica TaxID=3042023 RepID=A0ABT6J5Z4_9GAMM|nr:hypothetical protein [Luteimonas endophytica]MDH5822020.1 hypothetical protein [Luteimonas endophytica]